MMVSSAKTRGRPSPGGLACFLLALSLLAAGICALAQEPTGEPDSEAPPGLRAALARIDKLLAQQPLNLDALQYEYLVLFENFPRRDEGKKGIFALYQLLRQNKRIEQAYAVLMKILAAYQDNDTISNPASPRKPIAIAATANVELANLYAAGMNNPYQALDTLRRALSRYPAAYVSADAADRRYFGSIGVIARLQMADYYVATDAYNQATAALLALVSDFPGERVTLGDVESPASAAAVWKLQTVLQTMPASLSKKRRVLDTFSETAVERETRVWLMFAKAQLLTEEGRQVNSTGPLEDAIGALEEVLDHHPLVMLTGADGEEPAGVRALRLIVDICVNIFHNTDRATAELTRYYRDLGRRPALREIAAYAVLYLADVEYNQRHNAGAAYRYYMEVVDKFSDVPVYPRKPGRHDTLNSLAEQRAERAHSEM